VLRMTCVTIGAKACEETQKLFEGGEYTKYLDLDGLEPERSLSAIVVAFIPRKNTSYRKGPGRSSQYQV
jgi:hypothetical protein